MNYHIDHQLILDAVEDTNIDLLKAIHSAIMDTDEIFNTIISNIEYFNPSEEAVV